MAGSVLTAIAGCLQVGRTMLELSMNRARRGLAYKRRRSEPRPSAHPLAARIRRLSPDWTGSRD